MAAASAFAGLGERVPDPIDMQRAMCPRSIPAVNPMISPRGPKVKVGGGSYPLHSMPLALAGCLPARLSVRPFVCLPVWADGSPTPLNASRCLSVCARFGAFQFRVWGSGSARESACSGVGWELVSSRVFPRCLGGHRAVI
eukprot:COSAG02_NODE_3946_length_5997_cov_6.308579_4_plen_141_part_00